MDHDGAQQRTFDLSGGALCLDFANTLDERPSARPNEAIQIYGDLLAFARQARALPESLLARLAANAGQHHEGAEATRTRAIEVREAIYRIFLALADGQPIPSSDLASFNAALADALAHARVIRDASASAQLAWAWADDPIDLGAPVWPILRAAADLLTSPTLLAALRVCASDRCDWLFLDTSRNGSRRWCSMRTCGNRAKARRHHARVRAAASRTTA